MEQDRPVELDAEFDVLPYSERRDAIDLKYWHGVRLEAAMKARKLRNALGATGVLGSSGVVFAHHVEGLNFSTPSSIVLSLGAGLLVGSILNLNDRAKNQEDMAALNAATVGYMFTNAGLEPPEWTHE